MTGTWFSLRGHAGHYFRVISEFQGPLHDETGQPFIEFEPLLTADGAKNHNVTAKTIKNNEFQKPGQIYRFADPEAYDDLLLYLDKHPKDLANRAFYLKPKISRTGDPVDPNIWYIASARRGQNLIGGWLRELCQRAGMV